MNNVLNNAGEVMEYVDTTKYTVSAMTKDSKAVKISIDGYVWIVCPILKSELDTILKKVVL